MKIQRIADKRVFSAVVVPHDRTAATIPVAIAGLVAAVDEDTARCWVFTDLARLLAEPGDLIVFNGGRTETVLKAADGEPEGWRMVAEPQSRK